MFDSEEEIFQRTSRFPKNAYESFDNIVHCQRKVNICFFVKHRLKTTRTKMRDENATYSLHRFDSWVELLIFLPLECWWKPRRWSLVKNNIWFPGSAFDLWGCTRLSISSSHPIQGGLLLPESGSVPGYLWKLQKTEIFVCETNFAFLSKNWKFVKEKWNAKYQAERALYSSWAFSSKITATQIFLKTSLGLQMI